MNKRMPFSGVLVLSVSATLLLALTTVTHPATAAAVDKEAPSKVPSVDKDDKSDPATSENDLLASFDQSDLVHYYTSEEINKNRLMSMERNGVEYVQTDAEVIRALENVPLDKSSSFLTYPHDSVIEEQKGYANRKRQVIGYDDRLSASYPTCAVGYLSNGCTAFLIGPHHAITAGHCVYNCSTKTWTNGDDLDLHIGSNCNRSDKQMTFVKAWTYYRDQFCNPRRQKVDYNVAWILYDSNDSASCWSSISTAFSSPLRLCGYPADKHGMYCSWCTDAQKRPTSLSFNHTCDAGPGMNGSPMFGIFSSSARTFETAMGTFTQYYPDNSVNLGTKITEFRFQWSLDWMCENGYCTSPINNS